MWCRFQQYYCPFPFLLVNGSFERRFFRHLCNHVFGVRNFGNTESMRVIFFFRNFQDLIYISKLLQKMEKNVFCFWDNCISIGIVKFSLLRTGYLTLAANVLRSSPKILIVNKLTHLPWKWSIKMIKVVSCRLQQCYGPFTKLLLDASSETRLFRHLSNHVFGVRNFRSRKSMRTSFVRNIWN